MNQEASQHVQEEILVTDVWSRDGWELTWPLWHMLPRDERRKIARNHGFNHIGDFEEFMSLQQAERDTTVAYPNNLVYPVREEHHDQIPVEDEEEEEIEEESDSEDPVDHEPDACDGETMSREELVKVGGQILVLPDETLRRIFEFLPVDAYATLALVSPHWRSFTRTEVVYKRLCERLYLNQSKKKTLHVRKFENSYRTMLEKRPRVRVSGGFYVMKYSRVKKIQRDMWTEIPHGAVLESTYYRYLYFPSEDNRCLYALTSAPPHEMIRRFRRQVLHAGRPLLDDAVVWGTYQVERTKVTVQAAQSWQNVQLELTIQPYTMHGRNGYLSFDAHYTSESGDFSDQSFDRLEFEVPEEPFRFVRDRRL